MHKKLMMACMAIAAFAAFVMAPAASAATLTENGVAVPVGASITGQSSETKFTSSATTVTCSSAHMSGTLTANGGTVAGEILAANTSFSGTAAGGDCTSTNNFGPVTPTVKSKLCLDVAKGTDSGTVNGCVNEKGEPQPITFILDVTNFGISCAYQVNSIAGTITTAPEDAKVNISEQPAPIEAGQNFLCPPEGKLDMEFTLTTTDGTTLLFS